MSELDSAKLRAALGSFLTGVTIVTTRDADGAARGMTANSFSSVSLSPPLVSVCIGRRARSFPAFAAGGGFAVSVLADGHGELAAVFASGETDRFARGKWRNGRGGMILEDAMAWLDCDAHAQLDGGDHVILVGRVRDFGEAPRPPLGFFRGRFFAPMPEKEWGGPAATVGAIVENQDGEILLLDRGGAAALPSASGRRELSAALRRLGAADARVEFLFAVFENASGGMSVFYRGEARTATTTAAEKGGNFFAAGDIPWARMDPAEESMLRRYLREREGARFGIYAGDSRSGDIRPLAPR